MKPPNVFCIILGVFRVLENPASKDFDDLDPSGCYLIYGANEWANKPGAVDYTCFVLAFGFSSCKFQVAINPYYQYFAIFTRAKLTDNPYSGWKTL